jgi:hypothetical protein
VEIASMMTVTCVRSLVYGADHNQLAAAECGGLESRTAPDARLTAETTDFIEHKVVKRNG